MKHLPNFNCTACMVCASVCPKKVITFKKIKGFYEKVFSDNCIECGLCESVCPVLKPVEKQKPIIVFAAQLRNETVLEKSASGGFFPGLAEVILDRGGVVCGASIKGKEIIHQISDVDFSIFQGSKYLQSRTSEVYSQILDILRDHKHVLFSGTPCQVAAILSLCERKAIDKSYLYTIEVICHGVPSFSIIDIFEKKHHKQIKHFLSFRDKKEGWNSNYATSVEFVDGTTIRDSHSCFTAAFSGFKMLRKCCYSCHYKCIERCADFTIGDLWGGGIFENKQNGLSLVLVNTYKGESLLRSISGRFKLYNILRNKFWLWRNPNLVTHRNPYKYHPFRLLLNWNLQHLPVSVIRAFYCSDFNDSLLLKKIVHLIDFPYDLILNYERNKNCKKVLHNILD